MAGMSAYTASKAGVEAFANALRMEVSHVGVAVGTAHPGWIDTDLVRDADSDLAAYPSESFDYVVLSQTLQATRNPRIVIEHLVRIGRRAVNRS